MADTRYLSQFLFVILPQIDSALAAWLLYFAYHSHPPSMSKKSSKVKNKPRPPSSPASKREDPTEQKELPSNQMPPSDQTDPSTQKEKPSETTEPTPEQSESPSEKKEEPKPTAQPELKPETKDLPVEQTELKPETKDLPAGPPEPAAEQQDPPSEQKPANTLSPPSSAPADTRPKGGRQGKDEGDLASKAGEVAAGAVPNAGFELPGAPQLEEDKSSLKIKIHLNIRAKVRLELDAQIYGDVVIGLL